MRSIVFFLTITIHTQAQTYLPHIADAAGSFDTTVTLTNTATTNGSIILRGYSTLGSDLGTTVVQVPEQGLVNFRPSATFGNNIGHLEVVSASSAITMSGTYKGKAPGSAPANVGAKVAAPIWHVLMGDRSLAWDGIAVVNVSESYAWVRLIQRSASGVRQDTYTLAFMAPHQKSLAIISTEFNELDAGLIEVTSDEGVDLVVTALRGNSDSSILWENTVQTPANSPATESPLERARALWLFNFSIGSSSFSNTYAIADTGTVDGTPLAYGYDEFGDLVIIVFDTETGEYTLFDQGIILDRWYFFEINDEGNASGCYYQGVDGVITSSCYLTSGVRFQVNTKRQTDIEPILPFGNPPAHIVRTGLQLSKLAASLMSGKSIWD